MRGPIRWIALVSLLAAALAAGAQAPPPPPPSAPGAGGAAGAPAPAAGEEALSWDRDFDLLLELKDVPTRAELDREARRQALIEERERLARALGDLQSRLDSLQGTYSTETLLNEMLRQGASDMQTVVANLNREIKATKAKIADVDDRLKRLGPKADAAP